MKKFVIALTVLGSIAALADGYNVYTKVGVNLGKPKAEEGKWYGIEANQELKAKKAFLSGYGFNIEVTKDVNEMLEAGLGIGYQLNNKVTFTVVDKPAENTAGKTDKQPETRSAEGTDGGTTTTTEGTGNDNDQPAPAAEVTVENYAVDTIPVYATAKLNLMNDSVVKPYVKLDAGYAFATNLRNFKRVAEDATKNEVVSNKGGIYLGGAVGVEYSNFLAELAVKYTATNLVIKNVKSDDATKAEFKGKAVVGLNLGYKFSL